VSLYDPAVDPLGPAQIVSVNDQILHRHLPPVPMDRYSFSLPAENVPLTQIRSNSSMTFKRPR
jgi:hypothetical protein